MAEYIRDLDIREHLKTTLLKDHLNDAGTLVLDEFGIQYDDRRIDIAIFNGAMHGIEIKSQTDTLKRLQDQVIAYNTVFDHLTLIAWDSHIKHLQSISGLSHWQVLTITRESTREQITLKEVQSGSANPVLDAFEIARLLWKPEAIDLLKRYEISKGFISKRKDIIAKHIADQLPLETIREEVRTTIKARKDWRN